MKKLALLLIILLCLGSSSAIAETELTIDRGGKYGFEWTPNAEPDVASYVLYRNNTIFATILKTACSADKCESPEYTEDAIGVYTYTLTAKDYLGMESEPAGPCTLTVENQPPGKPSGFGCVQRMAF